MLSVRARALFHTQAAILFVVSRVHSHGSTDAGRTGRRAALSPMRALADGPAWLIQLQVRNVGPLGRTSSSRDMGSALFGAGQSQEHGEPRMRKGLALRYFTENTSTLLVFNARTVPNGTVLAHPAQRTKSPVAGRSCSSRTTRDFTMTKPAAAAVLRTSLNNKVVHVFDYGKTRDYRTVSPPASITLFLYDNSLQILEHSSNYMYAYAERKQLFTISLMVLVRRNIRQQLPSS